MGTALTVILPFWQQKWRSLLKLEGTSTMKDCDILPHSYRKLKKPACIVNLGEVEMVAEAVDNVAKVVEEVAIVTEKMAEDAAESLPEDDHKLKDALVCIENVSKKVAEEAHLTQDIIHKVRNLATILDYITFASSKSNMSVYKTKNWIIIYS